MSLDPNFAAVPKPTLAVLSAANANRDGTGTIVTLFTATAAGGMVTVIRICATSTTTAGMIRIYIYDGTNTRLFDEVVVNAITPSATVKAWQTVLVYRGESAIILGNAHEVRASTEKAETFHVTTVGATNS